MRPRLLLAVALLLSGPAYAETADVKYYGRLDLAPFDCEDYSRSSFIRRICYDQSKLFMVIQLNETTYPYCGIDAGTVAALRAADSMGRFYNASVKGRFDCRITPAPRY